MIGDFERENPSSADKLYIGCDEAGRGPLAGPVLAAAVCYYPGTEIPAGINDSKQLSEKRRDNLYAQIIESAYAYAIAEVSSETIDRINILAASLLAMKQAAEIVIEQIRLKSKIMPEIIVLADGNQALREFEGKQRCLVRGDTLSTHIASASILAKVRRDCIMKDYDILYPGYGFAKHKGYPTAAHKNAIATLGICDIHRKSFKCEQKEETRFFDS